MAKTPSRNRTRGRTGGGAGLPFVPGVTAVTLSNATISENAAQGAAVGALLTVPSLATLTLVDSDGDRFALSGPNLVRGETPLDYETATSHTIRVRAERGVVVNEVELTVFVTNVAEITNITLSTPTVREDAAAPAVVGALTSTPAGATFALTDTAGGRFAISGSNIIRGATALDYETATSHNITVRGTRGGETLDKVIAISVTNFAEITDIALSASTLEEGAEAGAVVGTLSSTPAGATFALTGDDDGRFALVGSEIRAGDTPSEAGERTITVRGTRLSETFDKSLTITITPAA